MAATLTCGRAANEASMYLYVYECMCVCGERCQSKSRTVNGNSGQLKRSTFT